MVLGITEDGRKLISFIDGDRAKLALKDDEKTEIIDQSKYCVFFCNGVYKIVPNSVIDLMNN